MSDNWLANPSLPADILAEAVPGNIRRAEHFLAFLRRFVQYLGTRLQATQVGEEVRSIYCQSISSMLGPLTVVHSSLLLPAMSYTWCT